MRFSSAEAAFYGFEEPYRGLQRIVATARPSTIHCCYSAVLLCPVERGHANDYFEYVCAMHVCRRNFLTQI
jgi:hypothetical protein